MARPIQFQFAVAAILIICSVAATASGQAAASSDENQSLAELTADQIIKRFYETLQFKTIWDEFYVKDQKLRNLEVEAITFNLVRYRAERLPDTRITMAARVRAYIAQYNFLLTLSSAAFTSSDAPLDDEYEKLYESISQRPKPYANTEELDREFTSVMNQLSDANRKLIVTGNVGSTVYNLRVHKFHETNPADVKRIREVFAEAGLKETSPIYVVQREMFHIYMIEENGEFRVLSILSRDRG
jgi:hypothetical protein